MKFYRKKNETANQVQEKTKVVRRQLFSDEATTKFQNLTSQNDIVFNISEKKQRPTLYGLCFKCAANVKNDRRECDFCEKLFHDKCFSNLPSTSNSDSSIHYCDHCKTFMDDILHDRM